MRKPISALIVLGLLLALPGCQSVLEAGRPGPAETPAPTATVPAAEPELAEPAAEEGEEAPAETPGEVVLTVWVAEPFAPSTDTPGGRELLDQLAAFDDANPGIRVEVYVKAITGPGSTLAYLRSAPPVAPGILPALALIDQDTLIQTTRDDLIIPLGALADPGLADGLYPAARQMGTVDGELAGLPYALQMQHVVYRETLFREPPRSFEDVLENPVPFVFPAGTLSTVNRTTLLQYLAAGGELVDENGQPYLDAAALAAVLEFYAGAREAGLIDPALFQISDPLDSWTQYLNRQAGLAVTTSTLFLRGLETPRSTGVSWVPTPDGSPAALASGWVWVIPAQEPERQAAALALLGFLMTPANQGALTRAAGWLPSQPAALAVWGDTDTYAAFADELLNHAIPLPDPALRSAVGEVIQDAVEDVLLNGISPLQAASSAAQRVNPPDPEGS